MSNEKSDKSVYKDTLNLPQTSFDMRAGLLQKEPAIQAQWQSKHLYGQIRSARAGSPRFVLHDGPPYANGDIHMGHALNKSLKDMVVRYKTMTGFDCRFVPGWDCHGLPIEYRVQSEVGDKLVEMSSLEVRRRCAEYAAKYIAAQSEQFQRLGVMGEFDQPYLTMAPQYEADVLEVLARLVEQGLVHRQLKPVHWSIENRTALAEAELEYKDRDDDSIFVLFAAEDSTKVKAALGVHNEAAEAYLMIWTTTPWTLPANMAVAVHPDYEYVAAKFTWHGREVIAVLARDLAEKVLRQGGVESFQVVGSVRGCQLADSAVRYRHPLLEGKLCPIVTANYVTLEDGTGLVHTATGHGLEDYGTGLRFNLGTYCPVQGDGTFDATAPAFLRGQNVWKANPMVVEHLDTAGALFHKARIRHSYPHDWRSKTPTIFRATEQWFVAVDKPMTHGVNLRDAAMQACRNTAEHNGIDFIPAWGRNRLAGMLESRPDWCISRQRSWGLPIPAFLNEKDEPLLTPASVRAVAKHFAKHGSDAWFTHTPAQLLESYHLAADAAVKDKAAFAVDKLRTGSDILDVWFESGSSWFAVAVQRGLLEHVPVDLYLEGSDQHRGWFQLSLLTALGAAGKPPFKTVLTHGFIVDEVGYKMSKSTGNTVDVLDQLAKRGADVLRLWVASQNYQDDLRCSEGLIAQSEDAYRKIRNTLRFCMGACGDFNPAHNAAEPAEHSLDRWMRLELHRLIRDVREAYDRYEFHKAARLMYEFCTVQASSVYMAAVKDRLYCDAVNSPRRRGTQTVLHEMLMAMVKLLAPIIPHTAEEAWAHIPFRPSEEPDSVHLAMMSEVDEAVLKEAECCLVTPGTEMRFESAGTEPSVEMVWDAMMDFRAAGLAKLEALRNQGVKNSLDAEAVFTVSAGDKRWPRLLELYLGELEDMLGVGYARIEVVSGDVQGAKLATGAGDVPVTVRVEDSRERYLRCARSWKRRPDVGKDAQYPDLSARDAQVVRQLKGKA